MDIPTFVFVMLFGVLLFTGVGRMLQPWRKGGAGLLTAPDTDPRVDAALRRYGVMVTSRFPISTGSHDYDDFGPPPAAFRFIGVDKAGVQVSGEVHITGIGKPMVTFDSSSAAADAARKLGRLDENEAEDTPPDPEELVAREVARRLDELQETPGAFLANDTNADGMVDADEWASARARIEAEVRLEFRAATTDAAAESEASSASPAASPDSNDNHW